MKIDEVVMFTSEIAAVEINTLRDEMTVVIPPDLEVELVTHAEEMTYIRLVRKTEEKP